MGTEPAISVLMSVHNGAAYLRESLESVLWQTFRDFEFVIVDDASTDGSSDVLREYQSKDGRIVLLANDTNLGLAASLNKGLRAARGRYIARHDADDISLPGRLRAQFEFLETNPGIFLLGGSAVVIDEKGKETAVLNRPTDEAALRRILAKENIVAHPSIMFRNDRKRFYREKFRYAQDYDFHLRLLTEGKRITNLPQILIKYRLPDETLVSRKSAQHALFSHAARTFYQQRLHTGQDDYERFEAKAILDLDIDSTTDPVVLRTLITAAFRENRLSLVRQFIRRYWRRHGWANRYWTLFAASLAGSTVLDFLRAAKRRFSPDRPVLSLAEASRRGMAPRLGLLFSSHMGLGAWAAIGTLHRELALYRRFAEQGWDVGLYTYDRTRALPDIGFKAVACPQWPFLLPRRLDILYEMLLPVLRFRHGRGTSILMTNQAHSGWAAILAGRLWKAKVVARCGYVFGETAETTGLTGHRVRMKIRGEKWTFRKADLCIIPTRDLADWAIRNYGIDPRKVEVIPNNVDTNQFQPAPQAEKTIDVLCVGRLDVVKRYDLILEALQSRDVKTVFIGSGDLKEQLLALASAHKMRLEIIERVTNEEMPRYLNAAKVYLIASKREGHPKSLIEAMACGCACVGTRCRGIENQIIHGETGLLADSDPQSISDAIRTLLENSELRRRLGENARRHAWENWSLDKIYLRHAGVFEKLLARAGGARPQQRK